MAAAAHFSTRIYGEIEGQPPFQNGSGAAAFSRVKDWPTSGIVSFPTTGTSFFPLSNGVKMANGAYVYSVIEVQASGLNSHSTKYVTDTSVATLATNAG
jgi:hypothetical protein